MYDGNRITYFAETDSRNKRVKFGIKAKDRTRHVYVIGKTGMGKSTLLENMAIQDLRNGEGMAFIDPHGKTAEFLLNFVPAHRINDVLYFAPFDLDNPISFNVMEDVGPDKRHLVANGLMSAFKKLFGEETFSDRMQYILQNTILALLEYPDATLLGINRMLTDKDYRDKVVANVTDTSVKAYWTQEFASYTERFAAEATPAIQNKIGQFTSNPLIRNIVGQPKSSFDIRKMMDEGKIIILNLSKGKVGEANANLLGSMLITKIYLAAMSRADVGEKELSVLPNFYLYVDEFQSFANESFANILSEARKYKLNLTIAHQYIEQMSEEVRAAVFGNVGTMISFRVGAFDAEILEKEFAPVFTMEDLVNLGFAQIYLKLMIDGISSMPFSAVTLPPIAEEEESNLEKIIEASRKSFSAPRSVVEANILKWHEEGQKNFSNKKDDKKDKGNSRGRGEKKKEEKSEATPNPFLALVNGDKKNTTEKVIDDEEDFGIFKKDVIEDEEKEKKTIDEDKKEIPSIQPVKDTAVSETKPVQVVPKKIEKPVEPENVQEKKDSIPKAKQETKQEDGEIKNLHRPKNPSKENVNSLKEALKSILKEQQQVQKKDDNQSANKKNQFQNEPQKNGANLNTVLPKTEAKKEIEKEEIKDEKKEEPKKPEPTGKQNSEKTQKPNGDSTFTTVGKIDSGRMVVSKEIEQRIIIQKELEKDKKIREVPEEVLRKVLDVKNGR